VLLSFMAFNSNSSRPMPFSTLHVSSPPCVLSKSPPSLGPVGKPLLREDAGKKKWCLCCWWLKDLSSIGC
jgi:hypothetical protein